MKTPLLLLLVSLGFVLSARADEPKAAPAAPSAFKAFQDLKQASPFGNAQPGGWEQMTAVEKANWIEEHKQAVKEKGLAFYEAYPDDPRRWSAVRMMLDLAPSFVTAYGPDFEKNPKDVTVDRTAADAWKAKLAGLNAAMKVATDLPVELRSGMEQEALVKAMAAAEKRGTGRRRSRTCWILPPGIPTTRTPPARCSISCMPLRARTRPARRPRCCRISRPARMRS